MSFGGPYSIHYRGLGSVYVYTGQEFQQNYVQFIIWSDVKPYGFIVRKKKMQATSQNALWDPWDVADLEEKLQVSGGT